MAVAVVRTVTMVVNVSPSRSLFRLSPSLPRPLQGRHAVTACGSIWFSVVAMVTSTTLFFPLGIRHPVLRYPVLSNSCPASLSLSPSLSVPLSCFRSFRLLRALAGALSLFFLSPSLPPRLVFRTISLLLSRI